MLNSLNGLVLGRAVSTASGALEIRTSLTDAHVCVCHFGLNWRYDDVVRLVITVVGSNALHHNNP